MLSLRIEASAVGLWVVQLELKNKKCVEQLLHLWIRQNGEDWHVLSSSAPS